MKKVTLTFTIVLVAGSLAQADSFDKPPETYAPVWQTRFPYQRNINMGFGVDPVRAPGNGIPGAVYEGSLDGDLRVNDYVTLTPYAQWYATSPEIIPTGLIGIDNRSGTGRVEGIVYLPPGQYPIEQPL